MSRNNETPLEMTLLLLLTFALTVPLTIWRAYVLVVIYGWYAPTPWPEMTIRIAVGITFVVAIMTTHLSHESKEKRPMADLFGRTLGYGFFSPLLSLGFARLMLWFV